MNYCLFFKLNLIFCLVLFFSLSDFLNASNCANKLKNSKIPPELNEAQVTLELVDLDGEARLPCRYCGEELGITGKLWRKKDLHGKVEKLEMDLHDDDTKNRIFTLPDHTLVIRNIKKTDAAYYFCYDTDNTGIAKMETLLDVIRKTSLTPKELNSPVNFDVAIPPIFKACEKLESVPLLKNYKCYALWGPWSRCSQCGKMGQRRKVGECRLQKLVKTKMKNPVSGQNIEAEFPIIGVGCHSFLLDSIPNGKEILSKIPNIVLLENCKVSCEGFDENAVTEMDEYEKKEYLKKIKIESLKRHRKVRRKIILKEKKEKEGTELTLFCPGATPDTFIKWKFKRKTLNPKKIKDKTGGRVTIDALDVLHIKELRFPDSGEYVCSMFDVAVGIIRLKVYSKYLLFDWTSNFGILTLVLAGCFIIYLIILSAQFSSYRKQKKAQRVGQMRGKFNENDEYEKLIP